MIARDRGSPQALATVVGSRSIFAAVSGAHEVCGEARRGVARAVGSRRGTSTRVPWCPLPDHLRIPSIASPGAFAQRPVFHLAASIPASSIPASAAPHYHLSLHAPRLPALQTTVRRTHLKLIQLVRTQQPVLVHIADLEYPLERIQAFGLERVFARVVQRGGRMQDGLLGKVEHFGDVERKEGGAFNDGLDFLRVSAMVSKRFSPVQSGPRVLGRAGAFDLRSAGRDVREHAP